MLNSREIVIINIEASEISLIIADILDNGLKNIKNIESKKHAGITLYGFKNPDNTIHVIRDLLTAYKSNAQITKLFVALASELAFFPFLVYQKDYAKSVKIGAKQLEDLFDEAISSLNPPSDWAALDIHSVEYIINGQSRTCELVGLTASSVELISTVSCYKAQTLNLLKDLFVRLGINDVFYFSACQAINKYFFGLLPLDKQEALIEITSVSTTLSVYKGAGVIKVLTVERGVDAIAKQIAHAFGVPVDICDMAMEKLNLAYNYDIYDTVTVDATGEQYSFYINDIFKIISRVMQEICGELTMHMENSDVMIPPFAAINLIGSGMKIKGLKEFMSGTMQRTLTPIAPRMKGYELPIYAHVVGVVDYVQELFDTDIGIISKLKKIFSK